MDPNDSPTRRNGTAESPEPPETGASLEKADDGATDSDNQRNGEAAASPSNSLNLTTTRCPPPGPDAFVRWYLGDDEENDEDGGMCHDRNRGDWDVGRGGVAMGSPSAPAPGNDQEGGDDHHDNEERPDEANRMRSACGEQEVGPGDASRGSWAAAESAVRSFMGPRTDSLQREIQQLRRRQQRRQKDQHPALPAEGIPSGARQGDEELILNGNHSGAVRKTDDRADEPYYESVSYRIVDTPVWHNYTLSLQDPERSPGGINLLRRLLSGELGWSALRRGVRRTRSNSSTSPRDPRTRDRVDPVRSYILDARFVMRIMIAMIGFFASVVGFVVSVSSTQLLDVKNRWVTSFRDENGASAGFGAFLLINLALGILAHVPVVCRPVSAGSGIAEAKAVLNGVILPSCTELRSAACKALSVVFSGAASLPVGLEGPLIFSGLSIGTNIHRLLLFPATDRPTKKWPSTVAATYPTLQTHRAQRDLAACGTAAGVTSAFFSPLGGVMFAMEEGCSFWSVGLAWQTFASSSTAVIFSYLWVLSFVQHKLGEPFQILSLGKFTGLPGDETSVAVTPAPLRFWFYALFAGMGIAAGILGSIWCEASRQLSIWRAEREMGRFLKLVEVLVLVTVSSCLTWWLPHAYIKCSPLTSTVAADTYFRTFGCPKGEYNQLATLLLNPPGEVALNLLFWEGPDAFSVATCLAAAAIYLVVLLLIFGSSISMGIFIPLLFVGACFGRALGVAMEAGEGTTTFAIVGSVAMLAGVTRILVSVTVIMMTATNTPYLVSCFMVVSLFARVTGKWTFGRDGIYDIILELKKIPFLSSTSPANAKYRGLRASDLIKSQPFATLTPEVKVGPLLEALESNPRLADFVVVDESEGAFLGVIAREDVLVLVGHVELFYNRGEGKGEPASLSYEYLMRSRRDDTPECEFTRIQSIRDSITEEFLGQHLDLTPYISMAHYQFDIHGSCERAYELFRTLGLRTLVVTSPDGVPRGIICRYDLKLLEEVNLDDRCKRLRDNDRNLAFAVKSISSS